MIKRNFQNLRNLSRNAFYFLFFYLLIATRESASTKVSLASLTALDELRQPLSMPYARLCSYRNVRF